MNLQNIDAAHGLQTDTDFKITIHRRQFVLGDFYFRFSRLLQRTLKTT